MHGVLKIALVLTISAVMGTSFAHAQATRTWVSGVGDDANPCSRTAPCKTFAGAISKTASGGEISVLDPGGYGGVTITKPLTLSGDGTLASILVAGTNGVNITTTTAILPVVTLRNLSLIGVGATGGLIGVNMINGAVLILDRVTISGFSTAAVKTATGKTVVTNSTITNNPGTAIHAIGGTVGVENSILASNGVAVQSDADGKIRLSNNGIYNNGTSFICGGGLLASAGNNRVAANGAGCAPNGAVPLQ
jgi:hypothetical protein